MNAPLGLGRPPEAHVSPEEELGRTIQMEDSGISRTGEAGVALDVVCARHERRLAENRDALESSNAFVEQHGLPLAPCRFF